MTDESKDERESGHKPDDVASHRDPAAGEDIEKYWTAERQQGVRPVPMPKPPPPKPAADGP